MKRLIFVSLMFVISALNYNLLAADKIINELDASIKADWVLAGKSLIIDLEDELTNKKLLLKMSNQLITTEQMKFDSILTNNVSAIRITKTAE